MWPMIQTYGLAAHWLPHMRPIFADIFLGRVASLTFLQEHVQYGAHVWQCGIIITFTKQALIIHHGPARSLAGARQLEA
jgi:hypothetical protein